PGQDRTQQQGRALGRFRRAIQAFLTSWRRRGARITPAVVVAQPDPMPSELKPEPDVGIVSTDGRANGDSAVTDEVTNSSTALPELTTEAEARVALEPRPSWAVGQGGQCWAQAAPGQGAEPQPTIPSVLCCSLQVESEKERVEEFMWQALPYVESPQEPLKEIALRFIGIAAKYLRKGEEQDEFISEVITEALQGMTTDSPAITKRAAETMRIIRDFQK
ncbi:uncharacterized protein LOC114073531, partial [Empidonax traillii]|uniref:uncharacterized protein LOC114073531 n=1 Tax=Empidonax traillii TaxID=164674 RepID=UPI000FFD3351